MPNLAAEQQEKVSVEEYLEGEPLSTTRHEYLAGQIFAMAGASEAHNTIALNLASELRGRLRGGPCRVFISDMKVRVLAADTIYYPDVVVTCSPADNDPYVKQQPCLVAEVLSQTTETTDRREKLLVYRQLPSLRDYLLISQDRRRVEVFHLEAGEWRHEIFETGNVLIRSLDLAIPMDDLYSGVFP